MPFLPGFDRECGRSQSILYLVVVSGLMQRDSRETQFYGNGAAGYRAGALQASINVFHIFLLEHGSVCEVGGQ